MIKFIINSAVDFVRRLITAFVCFAVIKLIYDIN